MKKRRGKQMILWVGSLLLLMVISACSTSANSSITDELKEESEKTVQYTTITGERVEIPADPKRVVYIGQTLGDFLAMEIPVVGNNLPQDVPSYYEGRLEGIVDIGNPGDLETILSLKPDLIINGYYKADPEQHEAFSKIATTIPFNPALPYTGRVKEMGNIFGKQEEAAQWIAQFETKSKNMFDQFDLEEGETATIFYQLGKKLYVMGNRSLGAIIYGDNGFAVPPAVQENIIDVEGVSFVDITEEALLEFAGDHLFVIVQDDEESKTEADRLLQRPIWTTLPAVQKGNVHVVPNEWNTDNLLALEQIFEQMPKWMAQQ
ncbi:ABC transporter substrate-binding protein [Paenibacillus silvae]|uniref:ABC transporter substrate-binding protein n=1 Tax=Paenibacillus silvae TaxID=1325358 RepID=UPI0025A23896|nr:ABC transporter substrate-binding protein [Paenibacillus silvae]MDM5278589.1 ABC transporter substrate-binding protein [Paenibacillus silvae]